MTRPRAEKRQRATSSILGTREPDAKQLPPIAGARARRFSVLVPQSGESGRLTVFALDPLCGDEIRYVYVGSGSSSARRPWLQELFAGHNLDDAP